jgi:hypothetical protein
LSQALSLSLDSSRARQAGPVRAPKLRRKAIDQQTAPSHIMGQAARWAEPALKIIADFGYVA